MARWKKVGFNIIFSRLFEFSESARASASKLPGFAEIVGRTGTSACPGLGTLPKQIRGQTSVLLKILDAFALRVSGTPLTDGVCSGVSNKKQNGFVVLKWGLLRNRSAAIEGRESEILNDKSR